MLNQKQNQIEEVKQKSKDEGAMIGIANIKGLGFPNSLILHLYNNWSFRQQISLINNDEVDLGDATQVLS